MTNLRCEVEDRNNSIASEYVRRLNMLQLKVAERTAEEHDEYELKYWESFAQDLVLESLPIYYSSVAQEWMEVDEYEPENYYHYGDGQPSIVEMMQQVLFEEYYPYVIERIKEAKPELS